MTDAHDPLGIIGLTIAEKYRVIELAGEGGFSAVYKAEHLIWKQPVAIKLFNVLENADAATRESLLNDFIQEGKLMSELSSRSAAIVQARDIGKLDIADGEWIPYMVLEWLEGQPLDVVIANERHAGLAPRGIVEAMQLLEPAATALDIVHRKNVAHRDLKPANIIVMGDPREPGVAVKVLDFGIAKVMEEQLELQAALQLTGQQITAFTPNYGAPEQFSRSYGATGPWTDVFAMALILVELLRGTRALDGEAFFELGVASCDPGLRPTPAAFGIQLPPQVEAVFAKALSVSPQHRYPAMGDFWRALHAFVFPGGDTWRGAATQQGGFSAPPAPPPMTAPIRSLPVLPTPGANTTNGLAGALTQPAGPTRGPSTGILVGVAAAALLVGGGIFVGLRFAGGGEATAGGETTAAPASTATEATSATGPAPPCPPNMSLVPGGSFMMGSDDPGFPAWKPAHKVTIDTFCLDLNEVTTGDYAACVTQGGCKPADSRPSFPKPTGLSDADHEAQLDAFAELCNGEKSGRERHPINCVDHGRATAYCAARGERLPTEAEWELAARGTDSRKFPWGDDPGDEKHMNAAGTEWRAWLAAHDLPPPAGLMYEADDGYPGTAPIGSFPKGKTETGQLDMVGNVWEWVSDWYAVYKPDDEVNPKGPAGGNRRAIRGGGFNGEFSLWINPAARYHQLHTASVHAVGFRCAKDVAERR